MFSIRYVTLAILLTGIILTLAAAFFTVTSLQADLTGPPTPILLSDHDKTEGNVGVSQWYGNHTLWTELNGSEGSDLFYSAPPFTQTIRLSDLAQTEGNANYMHTRIAEAADGTPHVIWLEETGTSEGYDLFYWTPVSGTLRLTDRNLTEGSPELSRVLMDIQIDENGQAHVIWNERGNNGSDLLWFYWNQASNTTQIIPGFSHFTLQGTTAHVAWADYDDASIHYWNSVDQTDVAVPYTTGSATGSVKVFANSAGDVYVYWSETFTPNCLNRWNAATQTSEVVVSGSNCLFVQDLSQDKSGKIHAIGQRSIGGGNYEAYYWNSSLNNALIMQTTTTPGDKYLHVADNGVAHVRWVEGTTPNGDMYHWDSATQTTTNLSAGIGANTPIGSYSTRTLLTADGRFNIAWQEGGSYYLWQSGGSTQNLEAKLGMSDISGNLILQQDGQGNVHMAWYGVPDSGDNGLFLWNEADDVVQRVWTGASSDYYFFSFSPTPAGADHIAWTNNQQAYYWNETDGETNLTVNILPNNSEWINLYSDERGNISVWWTEESGITAEGTDLYAAWIPASLNQFVYLPLVTR